MQVVDLEDYVSDKIFTVTEGETITYAIGVGGADGTGFYSGSAGAGTNTTLSGSSTGSIFTLSGGGGASAVRWWSARTSKK